MNDPTLPSSRLTGRVRALRAAIMDTAGVDPLASTSRRRPVAVARMMLTYRLVLDGWTEMQVGNAVALDHSTINHHRQRMTEILSGTPGYETERELWHRFNDEASQR